MDKKSYLDALSNALSHLDEEERNEVVSDYDSHFDSAYEDGMDDEAIISSLGEPDLLAQKYVVKTEELTAETGSEDTVIDVEVNDEVVESVEQVQEEAAPNTGQQVPYNSQPQAVKKTGRSPLGALVIAGLLIFINLTFVLGPFIAVWGVWFGGMVSGVAVVAEGIKMIVLASTVNSYSVGLSEITLIAQIGFYLSFGGCLTLLMVKAAKGLGILTKKYVLWNVKMVKGEA